MANMVVCLGCCEVLHSKYRHDFQMCGCPNQTFVDGGDDYSRIGGVEMRLVKRVQTLHEAGAVVARLNE